MSSYSIPVLPLRDIVVFPGMVAPLFVGRKQSVNALNHAMSLDKKIFLLAQKNSETDNPNKSDLYECGTVAKVLQLLKLPDGTIKVLVEGTSRAKLMTLNTSIDFLSAKIKTVDTKFKNNNNLKALVKVVLEQFEDYAKVNKKIPSEVITNLSSMTDAYKIADVVSINLTINMQQKQELLEMFNLEERLNKIHLYLVSEIDSFQMEKKIKGRVKRQMEKTQKEYYLNEQMKAIQKELGDNDDSDDIAEIEKKLETVKLSKEAKEKCKSEIKKLKNMSPMSAEATVIRNYLDWILSIPWNEPSTISKNIKKAKSILENDHYGLDKVKDRILEYLAVQKRTEKIKGPILCLVGPPGVGKTSLGKSIATATGRNFVRMSLGGVRDEAEIRGHRKTYIGSMPGKIMQNLSKVKTNNPLFLLDEIDKMAMDFRGDPSSALLEVLDPEQNNVFNDHYLEVDFDLSNIMFIATANSTDTIPAPLLDRMEVIRLPGYTENEKLEIAKKYLVPKQYKLNGLKQKELSIPVQTIRDIISYYTREAGVRSLDREINKLCRKTVKSILMSNKKTLKILPAEIEDYLGVKRHTSMMCDKKDMIGQANGLAWTSVGGEMLRIECVALSGKGKVTQTGQLGDVMQESIKAAITVVKTRSNSLAIDMDQFDKNDIHIHVPEGATPKDGPSAGITMALAVASTLSSIPIRSDIAMTGEITLRGEVLEIGGLKEKLLAALRAGIKEAIIPKDNEKDMRDMPQVIIDKIKIHPVKFVDEVFALALKGKLEKTKNKRKKAGSPKTTKEITSKNLQ